jgi:hypothetical protein
MEDEVRLPEGRSGNRVWRLGGQVLRNSGPWTPTVHAFLGHLEHSGFVGAPRVLESARFWPISAGEGAAVLRQVAATVCSPTSRRTCIRPTLPAADVWRGEWRREEISRSPYSDRPSRRVHGEPLPDPKEMVRTQTSDIH